jgi:4a-hydroxytetrahydrobiopterin dehydratase
MKTPKKLSSAQVGERLKKLPHWSLTDDGQLTRTFKLPQFAHSLLLANAAGLLAESADHHPDVDIRYNQVTFRLSTHSVGGLSEKDFELAGRINALGIPGK